MGIASLHPSYGCFTHLTAEGFPRLCTDRPQAGFRHESALPPISAMPRTQESWSDPARVVHNLPRAEAVDPEGFRRPRSAPEVVRK